MRLVAVQKIVLAVLSTTLLAVQALDNGLARTPPMGWMSWELFRCQIDCQTHPDTCISERLVREIADAMVNHGFPAAGYKYVIVDDCWLDRARDVQGRLQPDRQRFPSGIPALADYMHSRDLLFGLYGDIGEKTCAGWPGMQGHIEVDALTYADWGVDYLKVDGCYADVSTYNASYPELGRALNASGRPMVYSCSWPAYLPDPVQTGFQVPYRALQEHCNLWRNWVDIQSDWDSLASIIVFWAEASLQSEGFRQAAAPGSWNDPDMLVIGNSGITSDHARLQLGAWAMFAAPLIMGNDVRSLTGEQRDILLNAEIIAIDQDPAGHQGRLVRCVGSCQHGQIWRRLLHDGSMAVAFMNLQHRPQELCAIFNELGLQTSSDIQAKDLFTKEVTVFTDSCCVTVNATGIALFKLEVLGRPVTVS